MQDDDRLRNVELSGARVEEKLELIRHDASNTRMMLNALSALQDTRYTQVEVDIKDLSKTLARVGISVVGTLLSIMLSVIIYFVAQSFEQVDENHDRLNRVEQQMSRTK